MSDSSLHMLATMAGSAWLGAGKLATDADTLAAARKECPRDVMPAISLSNSNEVSAPSTPTGGDKDRSR